jgi:tetratricopeptide (TPR) repeat protein
VTSIISALLLYPLRGQGGVMLLIWTAALYGALLLIEVSRPYPTTLAVVGLVLCIAVVISLGMFLLYAWVSLRHVAAGNVQQLRHIDAGEIHPFVNLLALKVAFMLLAIAGVVHWTFTWSPIAGWLATLAVGIVLPAVLGVVVLEERLLSLLDGNVLWQFVHGLGVAYAGFAVAIYAGVVALYIACVVIAPPNVVAVFVASYVFVLGYVLAGRVLYTHREELRGTEPAPAPRAPWVKATPQAVAPQRVQRIEPLLVELHRLCGVDRVAEAARKLEAFLSLDNYALDESAYQRLLQFHDRRLLLEHSWHYLNRLVAAHKLPRAWLLLRDALAIDPTFRPATDAMVLELIGVAPERDALSVDTLLSDFERAYPDSECVDEALFQHARVLAAQLGRHDAALVVLKRIMLQFPQRAQTPEVVALHAQMQRFTDA